MTDGAGRVADSTGNWVDGLAPGWSRPYLRLARLDVLVIDDWGLAPVQDQERRDLLEILEDRYGTRSTIVTSRVTAWTPEPCRMASPSRSP